MSKPMAVVALEYYRSGLTVIPISTDGTKSPDAKRLPKLPDQNDGGKLKPMWRQWIGERQAEADVERMFKGSCGIAVLGGPVSGGLEIIDFDRAEFFPKWKDLVDTFSPGLSARLPIVKTPGGFHVYLRSEHGEGNQKLARAADAKDGGDRKDNTAIETRGKGGYVIAPPSPPSVHPTGKPYLQHAGSLLDIPTLTKDERDLLFSAARSLNEVVQNVAPDYHPPTPVNGQGTGRRPGDEFNERATWRDVLEPHGWTAVRQVGRVTYWRRPGKSDKGISATTGFYQNDTLYVFSSNAAPFDSLHAYSKFTAFVKLNHGGDFRAATKELVDRGFGEQRTPQPRKPSKAQWDDLNTRLDGINGGPPPDYVPPPIDEYEPPVTKKLDVEQLAALLDDDKAAALREPTFSQLLEARADHVEWKLLSDVLRRHKAKRSFDNAAKERDREDERKRVHALSAQAAGGDDLRGLLSFYGELPVIGAPVLPSGYRIRRDVGRGQDRLFRLQERERRGEVEIVEIPVADRVPLVSAIMHDASGKQMIECVWPNEQGKGWMRRAAPRERVLDAGKVIESFGPYGFPGSSETRRELVRWLVAYFQANEAVIEHRQMTEQCGWQHGGGFLRGEQYIGPEDKRVEFVAAGEGEVQTIAGLQKKRGTHEAWARTLGKYVHGQSKLEMALYASLAAPLLDILGAANFAIEWAGKTSSGKTTALRLAAGVWGACSSAGRDSLIRNWAGTKIGIERYLTTMCDLPTLLDDTQTARKGYGGARQIVEDVLYQLTSGGCLRGDKQGTRSFSTWRTVLLSTGEEKMADIAQGGGAAARVLTIWGSPLDGMAADDIHALREGVEKNYGHGGEIWIDFLQSNRDRWDEWRELYLVLTRRYLARMEHLPDQGVADRQAHCMAVLGVAAHLAVDALDLPWGADEFDPVEACLENFAAEIAQISRPKAAIEDCADMLAARLSQLWGTPEADGNHAKEPPGGWIGRVTQDGLFVDFHTEKLKAMLDEAGYQGKSIIRQWADTGVIVKQNNAARSRVRFNRMMISAYRISTETLAEAGLDLRRGQPQLGLAS